MFPWLVSALSGARPEPVHPQVDESEAQFYSSIHPRGDGSVARFEYDALSPDQHCTRLVTLLPSTSKDGPLCCLLTTHTRDPRTGYLLAASQLSPTTTSHFASVVEDRSYSQVVRDAVRTCENSPSTLTFSIPGSSGYDEALRADDSDL